MSGVSITGLNPASTLTGSEIVPIVQSGTTVRTTLAAMPYLPAGTGAVSTTVQTKLRETVSVFDFIPADQIAYIQANNIASQNATTVTNAIQAALNSVNSTGGKVIVPQGKYLINDSLMVGLDNSHVYGSVEFIGQGLPSIVSNNLNAPMIKFGGFMCRLEGLVLGYTSQPTNTQTDATAIRTYNLERSIINRIYMAFVGSGIDQYQGAAPGSTVNYCYSNTISNIVIQRYSQYGIKMIPYNSGNSGSVWSNIYINSNNASVPSTTYATFGAFWLQACSNEVIDLLNLEWQRNAGPLIVLNQAGNTSIRGIHIEGVYPTTPYTPLIDIIGGYSPCPTFDGITISGCDWTGYGGANAGSLFRLDDQGSKVIVSGVQCYNNTNPTYMQAVVNSGSTCYGSTIEFNTVNDSDGSLSYDQYTPKVNFGTAGSLALYPLLRWNSKVFRSIVSDVYYLPGLSAAPSTGIYPAPAIVMNTAVDATSARGWEIYRAGDFSTPQHGTVTYTAFIGAMTADTTAYAYFNANDYIEVAGTVYQITAKYSGNTFNVSPTPGVSGTSVACKVAPPGYRVIS